MGESSLGVKFAGLTFKNPILPGSSEIAFDAESVKRCIDAGFGGIVTKSYTLTGSGTRPRPYQFLYRKMGKGLEQSWFTRVQADCTHPDIVVREKMPKMVDLCREAKIPLIVNLIESTDVDAWVELAVKFAGAGADMLELNFACPHAEWQKGGGKLGRLVGEDVELGQKIIRAIKKQVKIPVMPKLSPLIGPEQHLVGKWMEAGADVVSAHNAPYGLAIDVEQETFFGSPTIGGYLPGRAFMPWSLARISRFIAPGKVDVCGIGGIFEWSDVLQYMLLGCKVVQVCSGVYLHGYRVVKKMLKGIETWMEKKGYSSPEEFIGKVLPSLTVLREIPMDESFEYRKAVYVPQINKELCNFCGRCADGCLSDVIAVDGKGKKVTVKEQECWSCGLCVGICPRDAITLVDRKTKKVMWANQGAA